MQLQPQVCQKDFHFIKKEIKSQSQEYFQFDSAEDERSTLFSIDRGFPHPRVLRLYDSGKIFKLDSFKAIEKLAKSVADFLNVSIFRDSPALHPVATLVEKFVDSTHNFHTDIPPNVDPISLTKDETHIKALNESKNLLPVSFVLLLTEELTPWAPSGFASTVVSSTPDELPIEDAKVLSCVFTNGGLSVFRGDRLHQIAPNPYFERATITYKIIYHSPDKEVLWDDVYDILREKYSRLIADVVPQEESYKELQIKALTMSLDNFHLKPNKEYTLL